MLITVSTHTSKIGTKHGSVVHWDIGVINRNYDEVTYWVWSPSDTTKTPRLGSSLNTHERVIDFIRSHFFSRSEILDLRFFDMEVLGDELTDYLDISDGGC